MGTLSLTSKFNSEASIKPFTRVLKSVNNSQAFQLFMHELGRFTRQSVLLSGIRHMTTYGIHRDIFAGRVNT